MALAFLKIEELVALARSQGYSASRRLVHDWVSLGLLDQPTRRGLGRGKGSLATWPPSQGDFFLALLDQRKRGITKVTNLCTMPVWVWLWYGESYISLRQVRRAMHTWCEASLRTWGKASTGTWEGAGKAARHLWQLLTTPYQRVRGKQTFVKAVTEMVYRKKIDRQLLARLVEKILHSRAQHRSRAGIPRDEQFRLHVEAAGALLGSRYETMSTIDEIADSTFQWARFFYHVHLRRYLREQPELAKSREWGHLFQHPTLRDIVSFACRDLVDTLSIASVIKAGEATIWNPETWRKHELRLTDRGEVVTPSGVIYPR